MISSWLLIFRLNNQESLEDGQKTNIKNSFMAWNYMEKIGKKSKPSSKQDHQHKSDHMLRNILSKWKKLERWRIRIKVKSSKTHRLLSPKLRILLVLLKLDRKMEKKVRKVAFLFSWKELLTTYTYIKIREKHLISGTCWLTLQEYRKLNHASWFLFRKNRIVLNYNLTTN